MVEIHEKQQNPSEILIKSSQIRMFLSKIEMVSKLLIEIRFVIMDFVIMDFVIIDFVSRMQIPTMNLDKKCGLKDHLNFTLGWVNHLSLRGGRGRKSQNWQKQPRAHFWHGTALPETSRRSFGIWIRCPNRPNEIDYIVYGFNWKVGSLPKAIKYVESDQI